jgi:molecular chaperone GrpE (heat shock protein)
MSDTETAISSSDVREYHVQLGDTLAPLGTLDGNPTLLVNDKKGWYITRDRDKSDDHSDGSEITDEFSKERRPRNFVEDYNRVAATQLDRTLYALTSYKQPTTFEYWEPARFDEDKGQYEYATSKPTPTAEDIAAVTVWGDIDLADDLKLQRPDLDAATYDVAEETYDAYIEAFADLYGGRDAVYMLDSVGGAYIFGTPEATLPITRYYEGDDDARARVMNELIERSNDYLHAVEQRINDEIEGASEVVHPDWANNINRQYKIPLTLHGDHDAVVTPVDVENVEYRQPVALEDVDDELRADVQEWCAEFTAVEYEKRVDNLVEALWPDEYDEHDGWASALDAWVEAERERERREQQRRQAAAERREQRLEELEEGIEGQPITPFLQDVYDAIDSIDTAEVVHHYASDEWDSGADMPDKTEFNPSWRASKSGRSCYVNHETNRFGDPGDSGGGYAPKAMALGKRIITDASDDLTGEHWAEAVDALRDAGYGVPVWTPEKWSHRRDGSAYKQMPFWAMRTAAVALGVLPEDGFTPKTTDGGSEYLGFPSMDSYNTALDEIEAVGLDHGRERASASGSLDEVSIETIPTDVSEVEPAHTVNLTDDELLKKARAAANGGEFKRLWAGDDTEYDSHAEAEVALCCQLAFWTAGDPEWINRLFRESNLMHDHWDDRDTADERSHGEEIVAKALVQTTNYYGSGDGSSSATADTSTSGVETVTEAESTTETQTDSVSGDGSGSVNATASPERVEQEKSDQSSAANDGTEPPATAASTQPEPSDSSSPAAPQSPSASVQASSAGDTDTGNESETETETDSSDETIALPPPPDGTPESNEQGGVESNDSDTARVSGNERTESNIDRATLQKQVTDTQEQLAALDSRLDEQKDLIEDLQDHLETISRRLDS